VPLTTVIGTFIFGAGKWYKYLFFGSKTRFKIKVLNVALTVVSAKIFMETKYSSKLHDFEGYFIAKLIAKSISHNSYVFATHGGVILKNFVFGYARVSTESQNLDRQIDALKKYGVDHIYNEKLTGTKRERPELTKMLERMTAGDTVVVESLSRLGRSTKDLIELTEVFHNKGVNLVSLKESIDTSSSTGKLLFTLMSAIAQFERDVISDRTREGLNSARARGRVGGRPKTNPDSVKKAMKLHSTRQYSVKEIEELTGVKKDTLYRNIQKIGAT